MSATSAYEISQRQGMVALGTNVYLRLETALDQLRTDLTARLNTVDEKDAVNDSFDKLKAIANSLSSDERYIKNENPSQFKDYIEDLKNVLKIVYSGIPAPVNPVGNPLDHIDYLRSCFFGALEHERNCTIFQVYTPITQLVRFLRNVEEHENKPVDALTGKKSHGNLYTLVSTFILVTYAYKEILETWLVTIKMRRP